MDTDLIKSDSSFSFHLDGNNEIDAEVLSSLLEHMTELSKTTALEINKDAFLRLKITTFKDGSFQIDFAAVCRMAEHLFIPAVTFAGSVVDTLKGFFAVKKFLRGHDPKSTKTYNDCVVIENYYGDSLSIPKETAKILKDENIDRLTSSIVEDAKTHNPEGGFSFSTERETIQFEKEDVELASKVLPKNLNKMCKKGVAEAVLLTIRRPDLEGLTKWMFRHGDETVTMKIDDLNFLERIHKGEQVGRGDYIIADVETEVEVDEKGNPIGSPRHTIIKVHGGVHRKEKENELNFDQH